MFRIHLRRWGVIYVLLLMFLGSWYVQWRTMPEPSEFWNATMENWQSEFLQLFWHALSVAGWASFWFKKDKDDVEEIKAKLNELLER